VDRTDANDVEPERGKRADVHEIDLRMRAQILIPVDELRPVLVGKPAAGLLGDVRTRADRVADVRIRPRVQMRNRAGSHNPHAHVAGIILTRL
jgi:hypothetical protein